MVPDEVVPDLSAWDSSSPAAQEWLLSDHPWARAERARRRAAAAGHDYALLERVRLFVEHIDRATEDLDEVDAETSTRVANTLAELTAPITAQSLLHGARDLDHHGVNTIDTDRERWVALQRDTGDRGYRYPQTLLGPAAADVPPPGFTYARPRRQRLGTPLEDLVGPERDRVAFITAAVPALVEDALVTEVGGYAPVQVVGVHNGKSWYHRHHSGVAELGIGGHPESDPEQYVEIEAENPAMFVPGAITTVRVIGTLFAALHPPAYLR
uniref:hypothetical protein n=1 Tax=Actinokineospora sp. CA-119265 TaxID=3239890 RepID=UPI003F49AB27